MNVVDGDVGTDDDDDDDDEEVPLSIVITAFFTCIPLMVTCLVVVLLLLMTMLLPLPVVLLVLLLLLMWLITRNLPSEAQLKTAPLPQLHDEGGGEEEEGGGDEEDDDENDDDAKAESQQSSEKALNAGTISPDGEHSFSYSPELMKTVRGCDRLRPAMLAALRAWLSDLHGSGGDDDGDDDDEFGFEAAPPQGIKSVPFAADTNSVA